MNHRNLKILILCCLAFASVIGLFALVYYSIPNSGEIQNRLDLAKAYERDTYFKEQLATNDALKLAKKIVDSPNSYNRESSPEEIKNLIDIELAYGDFFKAVSSNQDNIEIYLRTIQNNQDERAYRKNKLYSISAVLVVLSLGFGLLLFITRDPSKTK